MRHDVLKPETATPAIPLSLPIKTKKKDDASSSTLVTPPSGFMHKGSSECWPIMVRVLWWILGGHRSPD